MSQVSHVLTVVGIIGILLVFTLLCSRRLADSLIPQITVEYDRISIWDQAEITCQWPTLSTADVLPNRTRFNCLEPDEPILWSPASRKVTVKKRQKSQIGCTYHALNMEKHGTLETTSRFKLHKEGDFSSKDEQFAVECWNALGETTRKAFVDFSHGEEGEAKDTREGYATARGDRPSVAVLLLHSVSPSLMARALPSTVRFMAENEFAVAAKYNQLTNDERYNTELLLSGQPEGRGRRGTLMNMARNRGCVTMLNEETPSEYTKELLRNPASAPDFSLAAVHAYNAQHMEGECTSAGEPRMQPLLDHMLAFSEHFKNTCHFSLNRLESLNLTDANGLESVDELFRDFLSRFVHSSAASSTALVIMSATGNSERSGGLRSRIEAASPLLAAWLPRGFRRERNTQYSLLNWNMDKLISTADVHLTLRQLAMGNFTYMKARRARNKGEGEALASSLFDEKQLEHRDCKVANIRPEECLCMEEGSAPTPKTDLHDRMMESLRTLIMKELCVERIEEDTKRLEDYAFQLENTKDDMIWLNTTFIAILQENPGRIPALRFKARFRYYRSDDRLEYIEAVLGKPSGMYFCWNLYMEGICRNCLDVWPMNYLSLNGTSKGFLLDNQKQRTFAASEGGKPRGTHDTKIA